VFEAMGVLNRILDAAVQMSGQLVYVNGEKNLSHSPRPASIPAR
jgi:hypothetical protein